MQRVRYNYPNTNLILCYFVSSNCIHGTGIGSSSNCIYREDGLRQLEHEYEDQSFHFKCDDKTSMYGIFDGHDGYEVAKYALDTIAAEVLLNQLEDKISDEDVKTVLKYAN